MASHNAYITTNPGANRSTGDAVARDFQARQTPASIPSVSSGTELTTAHQFIRPSRSKLYNWRLSGSGVLCRSRLCCTRYIRLNKKPIVTPAIPNTSSEAWNISTAY